MRQDQKSADGSEGDFDMQIAIVKLGHQIESIMKSIGEVNDDETGGSGLAGRMARIETTLTEKIKETDKRVDHLYGLKQVGMGVVLAATSLSFFIVDGFKSWIQALWHGKSAPL